MNNNKTMCIYDVTYYIDGQEQHSSSSIINKL